MTRPKYKLPASSGGSGGVFLWFFILVVLLIIATVWFASPKKSARQTPKKNPSVNVVSKVTAPMPTKPIPVAPQTAPFTQRLETALETVPSPALLAKTNSTPALEPKPAQSKVTAGFPRAPRDTFEMQVALARAVISSGSIDGVNGSQTRAALIAFQTSRGLTPTGELDAATRATMTLDSPPHGVFIVTSNDLARLQPLSKTWLGKSQQTALDYETILELVAEHAHASPTCIRRLNPGVNWTNIVVGDELKIPSVDYPVPKSKAAFVVIRLAERRLQAFDENTNLLAHFPVSIAAKFEKRPVGELYVRAVAPNPDYTFNPEVFPESEEARQLKRKLILPPGPNNPVGTAWISLDRPGYGIHGTPSPEQVGRTESHGCFRLANWNAEHLIRLVWVGMPVRVEP
jgi:lipoprotein-anchoring transpeptidase ErfK/SrfK